MTQTGHQKIKNKQELAQRVRRTAVAAEWYLKSFSVAIFLFIFLVILTAKLNPIATEKLLLAIKKNARLRRHTQSW